MLYLFTQQNAFKSKKKKSATLVFTVDDVSSHVDLTSLAELVKFLSKTSDLTGRFIGFSLLVTRN